MPRYIDAEYLIQKINDNGALSRWAKDIVINACVMETPVVDLKCLGLSHGFSSVDELIEDLDRD